MVNNTIDFNIDCNLKNGLNLLPTDFRWKHNALFYGTQLYKQLLFRHYKKDTNSNFLTIIKIMGLCDLLGTDIESFCLTENAKLFKYKDNRITTYGLTVEYWQQQKVVDMVADNCFSYLKTNKLNHNELGLTNYMCKTLFLQRKPFKTFGLFVENIKQKEGFVCGNNDVYEMYSRDHNSFTMMYEQLCYHHHQSPHLFIFNKLKSPGTLAHTQPNCFFNKLLHSLNVELSEVLMEKPLFLNGEE